MELSIRDWMLVIGVLLLIAVVLDGYRKAQRERRNQVRLSRNAKKMAKMSEAENDSFESTAELPNGGARVVGSRALAEDEIDPLNPPEIKSERKYIVDAADDVDESEADTIISETFSAAPRTSTAPTAPTAAELDDIESDEIDPLFVDPFKHKPKNKAAEPETTEETQAMPSFSASEDSNHIGSMSASEPEFATNAAAPQAKTQAAPDQIIVLNVLAVDKDGFAGEDLLHILLACDCRFGEMNIFHRYEAENAQGQVQFSIVNMVEPGVFNLDDIQSFSTPGVSFFIRLPGPHEPIEAFEAMVETAQCLVRNLNGSLRDENHSTITEQTLEHLRERIRTYQAHKKLAH
jgi:cell division protein ZipA